MIVAQRMGFGGVIGVEVSEQLAATARENLGRQKRRPGAEAARVIVADASEWEPPPEVTVAFMYSPFTGPVFAAAIRRLLDSVDRHPRRMRLVYNNPFEHNYLLDTGRFRPVITLRSIRIVSRGPNSLTSLSIPNTLETRPPAVAFANSTNW